MYVLWNFSMKYILKTSTRADIAVDISRSALERWPGVKGNIKYRLPLIYFSIDLKVKIFRKHFRQHLECTKVAIKIFQLYYVLTGGND